MTDADGPAIDEAEEQMTPLTKAADFDPILERSSVTDEMPVEEVAGGRERVGAWFAELRLTAPEARGLVVEFNGMIRDDNRHDPAGDERRLFAAPCPGNNKQNPSGSGRAPNRTKCQDPAASMTPAAP